HLVSATRDLANHATVSGEVGWTLLAGLGVIAGFAPLSVRSYRRHKLPHIVPKSTEPRRTAPRTQPRRCSASRQAPATTLAGWRSSYSARNASSWPGAARSAAGMSWPQVIVGIMRW